MNFNTTVSICLGFIIIMKLVYVTSISLQSLEDHGVFDNNSISVDTLLRQNKNKELELEKAQKVNKNFERMIQLVNILGQVDSFLAERTRSMLRKLALLAEDDDGYYRRRRS